MSFTVTARKYRPQRFDEVVGQEHITQTLKNAIQTGRVAHAYLFTGPRGVGKTTTARILAKSINCANPQGAEPCNTCPMCLSIQSGQLIDIIEIDAASNRGIDEIRSLRESVQYAPSLGKYKVYIIDEVHMLTKDSFNAFLKTLEEPPPHIVFIFATTDVHRVPLTILSRCQRYDFRRIQLEPIKQLLLQIAGQEGIEIDDKTLTLIAKKADGGLRDAESFFDQVVAFCGKTVAVDQVSILLNVIDDDLFFDVSDAISVKDYKTAFRISETLYKNGWNYADFLEKLIEHFRNILVTVVTGSSELIETAQMYKQKYLTYKGTFSESDILRIISFIGRTAQELRYSQNQKIKVELAIAHIIGLEQSATITELINEIDRDSDSSVEVKKKSHNVVSPPLPAAHAEAPVPPPLPVDAPAEAKAATPPKPLPKQAPVQDSQETVQAKWHEFSKSVINGKKILLSGVAGFFNFEKFEQGTIYLNVSNADALRLFSLQKNYIEQKAAEFFGKKYAVKFSALPSGEQRPAGEEAKAPVSPAPRKGKALPENDEHVQFIVQRLGGEQIT